MLTGLGFLGHVLRRAFWERPKELPDAVKVV
jgi:hypothetical protein